jgi:hypothetical protein
VRPERVDSGPVPWVGMEEKVVMSWTGWFRREAVYGLMHSSGVWNAGALSLLCEDLRKALACI